MSNPSVAVGVLTEKDKAGAVPEQGKKGGMTSVVFAGSVGTIIEWYDFLIYGTAAALVFNTLFFPNVDPLTGTLAALGTYAAGFVARPVGGAIFGHFGDRMGRKTMLMLTMVIMALGTFAVGLLPTYEQIGILGADPVDHVASHSGHRTGRRMGRCVPDGAGTCAVALARIFRQPRADRLSPRPGDIIGRVRAGHDDAGGRFQGVGVAHPLPDQHPAAGCRLVRALARAGNPGV